MLKKVRTARGGLFSVGAYKLWKALGERPIEWLAAELGITTRNVVNRYLYGDQRPNAVNAHRIHERFGIEPRFFFTQPRPGSKAAAFVFPAGRKAVSVPAFPLRTARKTGRTPRTTNRGAVA